MAIDFPTSPTLNQEYTFEGRTWLWNGTGWEVKSFSAATGGGFSSSSTPPATPSEGDEWLDEDIGVLYTYIVDEDSSQWVEFSPKTGGFVGATGPIGATGPVGSTGATGVNGLAGGSTDLVFFENDQTVTTSYTLSTGKNAMTVGPITINSGATVTVPSGASWVIV